MRQPNHARLHPIWDAWPGNAEHNRKRTGQVSLKIEFMNFAEYQTSHRKWLKIRAAEVQERTMINPKGSCPEN